MNSKFPELIHQFLCFLFCFGELQAVCQFWLHQCPTGLKDDANGPVPGPPTKPFSNQGGPESARGLAALAEDHGTTRRPTVGSWNLCCGALWGPPPRWDSHPVSPIISSQSRSERLFRDHPIPSHLFPGTPSQEPTHTRARPGRSEGLTSREFRTRPISISLPKPPSAISTLHSIVAVAIASRTRGLSHPTSHHHPNRNNARRRRRHHRHPPPRPRRRHRLDRLHAHARPAPRRTSPPLPPANPANTPSQLPPPPLSSYIPFLPSSSSPYGAPTPAPGGIVGWFNDRVRAFKNRNNRTAAGAYEGSHSTNARGLDPDDAWDTRVGGDPYGGSGGGGGAYQGGEGYHMNVAYGEEEQRGRGRSRSPGPGQGGRAGLNPFAEGAEPSNLSMRGVSPRPIDTGVAGGKKGAADPDSPEGRRSVFRENV